MTALRLRPSAAMLALAAVTLLAAGCSTEPSAPAPTSSIGSDDSGDTTVPVAGDDIETAWLDDGRMFAIVTWGSSTCVPLVDQISADGQKVTVVLADAPAQDGSEKACTSDLTARASTAALPEGVDPTQDVEFTVTFGDVTDDVDLDGNPALTGIPGQATEYAPSAGWFDDDGIVLLTWGSSGCPPVVERIDEQDAGATVTFKSEDRVCTMDMAPRTTILTLGEDVDEDRDFTLSLVGDDLDATVEVLRG